MRAVSEAPLSGSLLQRDAGLRPFLRRVERELPGFARVLARHGDLTLAEYAAGFPLNRAAPLQPRGDLFEVVEAYARRLLGPEVAARLGASLRVAPVALTANHHGLDTASQTVQCSLVYALSSGKDGSAVAPVFAFGDVPLNNAMFPRGFVLARRRVGEAGFPTPVRISLFPVRHRHTLVSAAPPLTREMVRRARRRTEALHGSGALGRQERDAIAGLLDAEVARDDVLGCADYSDQAVLLNYRIWPRLFAPSQRGAQPRLVFLEMERITSALLERDLDDPDTLAHALLFRPDLRDAALHALHGVPGCWSLGRTPRHGTAFFWGLDECGARVRLALEPRGRTPRLAGRDARGRSREIVLEPDALLDGLRRRAILPGLFLSFLVVAFARAIKCYGGFTQADYLPRMQRGLADALRASALPGWAKLVEEVPTANCVGMTLAVARYGGTSVRPAGAVELLAKGGLDAEDRTRMGALSVAEACSCTLMEMYPEIVDRADRDLAIYERLAQEVTRPAAGRLVEVPLW